MKSIRTILIIGTAAFALAVAHSQENKAVKDDLAQLQGEWVMISGSADGEPMPDDMLKQMKRVCKGDELTVMMGYQVFMKAKITIHPSSKPKTIDYQMLGGFTKGKKQLGIYELEGDKLKSCFGAPGAERPADFSTKSGDKRTFSVWKRQDPKKE